MAVRGASYGVAWTLAALTILPAVGGRNLRHQQSEPLRAAAWHPQVGGAHVVTLLRNPTSNRNRLEFLSVTVFPGRGMNVFQITANIPGKG